MNINLESDSSIQPYLDEVGEEPVLIFDGLNYYFEWYGIAQNGDIFKDYFPITAINSEIKCPLDWVRVPSIVNLNNPYFSKEEKENFKKFIGPWALNGWIAYCLSGKLAIANEDLIAYPEFYCQICRIKIDNEIITPLAFDAPGIIDEEMEGMFNFLNFDIGAFLY